MTTTDDSLLGPGWRPDPTARHQYRFWDGKAWTAQCADDGQTCRDDMQEGTVSARRQSPLRRVLWCIYAVPLTVLAVPSIIIAVGSLGILGVIDGLASATSLLVLQLHIWDKRVLQPLVWRIFAFGFVLWDLAFNVLIEPAVSGTEFRPLALTAAVVLLPLYVALFRYAFRSWATGDVVLTSASS